MEKKLFLILALLSILFSNPAWPYQKGIALGLFSKEAGYSYEKDLRELRDTGADHVSLVVSWYQKDITSHKIYPRPRAEGDFETIADKKLIEAIQQARHVGLQVFLFPILRIEHRKEKEWRGVVAPRDRGRWLENYRAFTLHYARLAADHQVELFSVGSELCSVEQEVKFWRALIADIRGFYPGKLLYSANWDHYQKIGFWEDLDYLGLNGYYELADHPEPTLKELLQKWWDIENELTAWQERFRKKIIFTEIGYPSIDGACGRPWDYTRDASVDLEEQALCYEAFFLSWARSQRLAGVYFWNWYGQGGGNDRSYTPRGKPAERILRRWFREPSLVLLPQASF